MLVLAALLGFGFGFVGSIPIAGPVAALVFSRGLEDRTRSALYLGAGAALAEGGYAYLAFWGFAELLTRHAWIEPASRIAAAAMLTGLGAHFVRRPRVVARVAAAPRAGNSRSFLLGLTIAAFNPALIAIWAAAVTALYSLDLLDFDPRAALPFSIGACSGIAAWFATLLGLIERFRTRISREALHRVRRGMGVMLIVLGLGFAAHPL
jgi:threonine/homoserine/homoserine lactone efflux protein